MFAELVKFFLPEVPDIILRNLRQQKARHYHRAARPPSSLEDSALLARLTALLRF